MEKTGKQRRKLHNEQSTLRVSDASAILGISQATVRNWAKLGKLNVFSASPLLFLEKDVYALHKELESSGLLRSRRNKTRLTGNLIPKTYIDSASPNYIPVKELLEALTDTDCSGQSLLPSVIRTVAKELLSLRGTPKEISLKLLDQTPFKAPSKEKGTELNSRFSPSFIPGEDLLGMLYLSLRSLRAKKNTGAYYTPYFVVDRLVSGIPDLPLQRCCDPACGTGNFLIRLPDNLPLECIYGYDIDETAIAIARINVALKYNIQSQRELDTIFTNIRCSDFLGISAALSTPENSGNTPSFSVILGNPPWGYVFSKDEISRINESFVSYDGNKTPESFSLFVEKGLEKLKEGGTLSFLLPETILGTDIHKRIRSLILKEAAVTSIIYLGDVFDKVQCPSVILTLSHPTADHSQPLHHNVTGGGSQMQGYRLANTISVSYENHRQIPPKVHNRFQTDGSRISPESFHILCNDTEYALLQKIGSVPHFTLQGNADFALGIVTGANRTLLKDVKDIPNASEKTGAGNQGLEPILKGKDIEKFLIRKATSFVHFDPDSFQQCAPTEMYRAKEKLFYRFIAEEPVVALDRNGSLSLNSANIIIPHVEGYSATYIMALLNSQVLSFYYQNTFRSMKVLRSYLEALPLAKCSPSVQSEIENCPPGEKLDKMIAALYGINAAEYKIITS